MTDTRLAASVPPVASSPPGNNRPDGSANGRRPLLAELTDWASTLRLDAVPDRVAELATSQVLSQLAAARAGLRHPLGRAVVTAFGPPGQADPKQAAYSLAGLTSWLHVDDTAFAGHLSNSTVTVPVSYARAAGRDGAALLAAVVAANECAARITAAAALSVYRGQSAAHTHLVGAVAGRLHCERAPAHLWRSAIGLALGMPPATVAHGFLGSDAKVLSASTPVRAGLDACDAAAGGLTGAADILEHPNGFLARFATVPLPELVTAGLGERWHTDTLSFKLHPGGPGMDGAVDCAIELARQTGPLRAADIDEVVVEGSLYTTVVNRRTAPHLRGPDTPVSALVFAMPYLVATALLTGTVTAEDFAPPAVADPQRWALAAKVRVEHDPAMTRELFRCEIPFGEALRAAGERGRRWLAEFAGSWDDFGRDELLRLVGEPVAPSRTFETARKVTPARLRLHMSDGSIHCRELDVPLGGAGSPSRDQHAALVREKFLAVGGAPEVADRLLELPKLPAAELNALLRRALRED